MSDRWLELAKKITANERIHDSQAEIAWQNMEVIQAVRLRGVAEGLALARAMQLKLSQEEH